MNPNASANRTNAALGLDGGASVFKLALAFADGDVIHAESPGANPALTGMEDYLSRLEHALQDMLVRAGCDPGQVVSAGFGLAGVDRPDEIRQIRDRLRGRILQGCRRLWIGNDALPALRLGAGGLRGIVLIAGTGSICVAADGPERTVRVGGWGSELGDEGSGYWIGLHALRAACRMADGRGEPAPMFDRLLERLNLKTSRELIPWTAKADRGEFKARVAELYPVVAEAAREGDATARRIVDRAVEHLVEHALTAFGKLSAQAPETQARPERKIKLVCAGGLFRNDRWFYDAFAARLSARSENFDPVRLTQPASLGALMLGKEAPPLTTRNADVRNLP